MFVDSIELRESAKQLDLIQDSSVISKPYHMWQPTPSLLENIQNIENKLNDLSSSSSIRTCIDCGCGAGRDAVFLALRKCWQVFAVDNMPKALKRVEHLRDRCEVTTKMVEPVLLDVKKNPQSLIQFIHDHHIKKSLCQQDNGQEEGVDMVLVARFFHRPLLTLNILKDIIKPGGFIFFHHFLDGVQNHKIGHPSSPSDYAEKGELLSSFEGWHVMMNDEITTLSDGRPMVNFIAQRPL